MSSSIADRDNVLVADLLESGERHDWTSTIFRPEATRCDAVALFGGGRGDLPVEAQSAGKLVQTTETEIH